AQAVGISLFAALITFALNALETDAHEEIPVKNFLFLGSNALFAMSAACLISSTALVFLVVLTYTFSINPDNVATPLASSFGDLLTIGAMKERKKMRKRFATKQDSIAETACSNQVTPSKVAILSCRHRDSY
ncbi:hypothetical protein NECAME_18139, partial [Necator americanus]